MHALFCILVLCAISLFGDILSHAFLCVALNGVTHFFMEVFIMRIESELFVNALCEGLRHMLPCTEIEIDINEIAQTTAINALSEIYQVLHENIENDFEIVEKIVCIFEKYQISSGTTHDFG